MRAANGGQVKRLEYALADVNTQITNSTAANGRIMDVDIAEESAALAKHKFCAGLCIHGGPGEQCQQCGTQLLQ